MSSVGDSEFRALRDDFGRYGQEHIFAFWDRLDGPEQAGLLEQARRIGPALPALLRERETALKALDAPDLSDLTPPEALALPEHGGNAGRLEAVRPAGEALLSQGKVGVLVVAGGQGTRLGFAGPKGAFPIGPVTDRTLFGLQAQKVAAVGRRSGRPIHWFVMTSPATDADTRALFEAEAYFGLDSEHVFIFSQGTVPAWSFDGRLILQRPDRIFESPGGHGDTFLALAQSGALDRMDELGIERLFYYHVDNPLVTLADPTFLGLHETEGASMSCKVIRKVEPMEKLGVLACRGGRPQVVEYTELPDAQRHARDANGDLVYWAGNTGIHVFNLSFLRRVADDNERLLPYHASPKPIPTLDAEGLPHAAPEANGHKLERFVFDALPAAEKVCVLEARKDDEYAPVKNATGSDSPEVTRDRLNSLYRGWMTEAGVPIPGDVRAIEIDHAIADSAAELTDQGWSNWEDSGAAIRIARGTRP